MWEHLKIFKNSKYYKNYILIKINNLVYISVTDGHTLCMIRWNDVQISKFNKDCIRVLQDDIKILQPFENIPIKLELINGTLINDMYGVSLKLLPTAEGFTNPDLLLKWVKKALNWKNATPRHTIPVSTFRNIFNFSKYMSQDEEPVIEATPTGATIISDYGKSWIIITMPIIEP